MDHIPTPRAPKYPTPEILCFVRPDFSPVSPPPFDRYPESRGWQQAAFVAGDFRQGHTDEKSREFLQEWLYFKVLAAVFNPVGIDIDMDDFTRRKDGQLLIDTTNLVRYISEFEGRFRDLESQTQIASIKAIDRVLSVTQRLVVRECSMVSAERIRSENWPFDPMTSLSFMILGCTLTFAVGRIVQVLLDKTHALEIYKQLHLSHRDWGVSNLLYERMRANKWCPHSLAQFASGERSVLGMYYANLLDIPSDEKDHGKCEVHKCIHTTVNEKDYTTKHDGHSSQECARIPPDSARESIIRSLKSKSAPLLKVLETETEEVEVNVVPYKEGIKYVAISHVWAHGLGNVDGNWLFSCQVRRLYRFAAALYPFSSTRADIYIWIDTICVPHRSDDDDKDYRKVAISLLDDTYRNADKVLVLDDQLVRSTSRVAPEEALIRILSSGWMTRLWTLQEGMLAGKLRFQFQERALDVEDMLSGILPIHYSSVWLEILEFFSSLRKLKTMHPWERLRCLWNYLQWRSTSHASDEITCLSVLTGKKPSAVPGLSHADRMKAFLNQMDGIPSDIIFMPGPRLPGDGWKWAPTSFMARYQWTAYSQFQETIIPGVSDHTISDQTDISRRSDRGLRVHFLGITLLEVPPNLNMIFRVEGIFLNTKMWFLAISLYDRCPPEWSDIDIQSLKNPTIILQSRPETFGVTHAIFVDAYEGPGIEGPVLLDRTAQKVTPTRFICRMTVGRIDAGVSQEARTYFEGDEQMSCSCKGKLLSPQWWYVG
ncbi:hypothetical protein GP486_003822 [Trichoglossum hirsutum]|uniref:Heterokaryon incompatibility domain-containing protein n=1 Tax=Trichoglossum hirsutum TaxID=265104 RepID=A0A9P8RQN4_9PEZI|nr:hypothetical protein GP486_003822 [Trichoglossum hirsutum]